MTQQATIKENINKLIEFRLPIYEHGILARKDALFGVLDAIIRHCFIVCDVEPVEAVPAKTARKSSAWPKGRHRTPGVRHLVLKKHSRAAKMF